MDDVRPLGSQVPTHHLAPVYERSFGPSALSTAKDFGYELDPWQVNLLMDGLAFQPGGKWCALHVVLVVSRQNGKSLDFEVVALWALFVARKKRIVYTAHKAETAKKIFERIQAAIKANDDFADELMPDRSGGIRTANGEWQITLRSGQYMTFRTRTNGGGRGLDDVDLLFVDEVQDYTDEHQGALEPIISANANPQVWYAGSAGGKGSTVMARLDGRMRERDTGLVYHGWHADPDVDDLYSDATIAKTNPSVGRHLQWSTVDGEKKGFSASFWARERVGVADYPRLEGQDWIIPKVTWEKACDPDASIAPGGPLVLVPEAMPDLTWASISAAGRSTDRVVVGELVERDRGSKWLRPALVEIAAKQAEANRVVVAVDPKGPAKFVIPELKDAGLDVLELATEDVIDAFAWVTQEMPITIPDGWAPGVRPREHKDLTSALAAAQVRKLGNRFTVQRHSSDDVTPFVSWMLAAYAVRLVEQRPAPAPPPAPVRAPARAARRGSDLNTIRF